MSIFIRIFVIPYISCAKRRAVHVVIINEIAGVSMTFGYPEPVKIGIIYRDRFIHIYSCSKNIRYSANVRNCYYDLKKERNVESINLRHKRSLKIKYTFTML